MPRTAEQQRGIDYESRVAQALGGRTQPGSGATWHSKSDVRTSTLLISAKAEKGRSWSQTRRELAEAIDYSLGTGLIPGLAVLDDDGAEFVILRLDDLALALSGEAVLAPVKSGGETRRARADVPSLLREA